MNNIDDRQRAKLQAAIASFEYWIPSISECARIAATNDDAYWRVSIEPHVAGACPFELVIRTDGFHDMMIAGESYEDQPTDDLDLFVPFAQAIANGDVKHRIYTAAATRMPLAVETIVHLANGVDWRRRHELVTGLDGTLPHEAIARDRRFLPYERT
jgi:hypothetical protein